MAKLEQLFGLQKIAENKELGKVISEVHKGGSMIMADDNVFELDDDMLEFAAAGRDVTGGGRHNLEDMASLETERDKGGREAELAGRKKNKPGFGPVNPSRMP